MNSYNPPTHEGKHPALGCLAGSFVHFFIYNLLIFIVPAAILTMVSMQMPPIMGIGHYYVILFLALASNIAAAALGGWVFARITQRPAAIYWLIVTFIIYFFLFPYSFNFHQFNLIGIGRMVNTAYHVPFQLEFLMRFVFMAAAPIAAFFGSRFRQNR